MFRLSIFLLTLTLVFMAFFTGCKDGDDTTQPPPPNDCRITVVGKETGISLGGTPKFDCSFEFYFEDGKKRTYTEVVDTACNRSQYAWYEVGVVVPNCKDVGSL